MPYDWDAEQAREAAQQDAVEAAVSALNRLADSPEQRADVVAGLLASVHGDPDTVDATVWAWIDSALSSVRGLDGGSVEERLLTMRVCTRMLAGLASLTEAAWLRASLLGRDREDAAPGGP